MSLLARRRGIIGAGGAVPFEPELVTGAVAAWVADDLSAVGDGGAIGDTGSEWVDRVASITVSQATATRRPTYDANGVGGQPAVVFVPTASEQDALVVSSGPFTQQAGHIFIVMQYGSAITGTILNQSNGSTQYVRVDCDGTNIGVRERNGLSGTSSQAVTTAVPSLGVPFLIECVSTGSAYEVRLDNTVQTLAAPANEGNDGDWFGDTTSPDRLSIGAAVSTSGTSGYMDGSIAAVLIIGSSQQADRTVFDDFFAQVEAKYGLTLA